MPSKPATVAKRNRTLAAKHREKAAQMAAAGKPEAAREHELSADYFERVARLADQRAAEHWP